MVKLVVCMPDPDVRASLAASLEGAGIAADRLCATGAEVIRYANIVGDCVVICSPKMRDRTADELAYDLGHAASVLVVGRPDSLDNCENPELFRLPSPFSGRELASAIRMLTQLAQMRKPRRSDAERDSIEAAKAVVMVENGLTEDEAHRFLQRLSMKSGRRLADAALAVLKERGQYA